MLELYKVVCFHSQNLTGPDRLPDQSTFTDCEAQPITVSIEASEAKIKVEVENLLFRARSNQVRLPVPWTEIRPQPHDLLVGISSFFSIAAKGVDVVNFLPNSHFNRPMIGSPRRISDISSSFHLVAQTNPAFMNVGVVPNLYTPPTSVEMPFPPRTLMAKSE